MTKHTAELQLRPAQLSEAAHLSALALRSKAYWGYSPAQIDCWREELAISAAHFELSQITLAEQAGQILGFYVLNLHEPARLEHLWVDPQAIGQGVGKRLFYHACECLRLSPMSFMHIEADPNALGFYQSQGAQHVGNEPAPIAGEPARTLPQLIWHAH